MKRKTFDRAVKAGLAIVLALTGLGLTACGDGAKAGSTSSAGASKTAAKPAEEPTEERSQEPSEVPSEEPSEEPAVESPVFEIDGVTLAIVDPAGLADAEGSFKTFLGDTHITGGTIALAGSSLPGEYLVNTTEYQDGLLVMMAVDGTVSDFEALAKGAALDQDGSTVRPDVAWASSEFLVLVFGAADQAAEVAFAGTGGTAIKLMAK